MGQGYRMFGFVVIVILYVVVGFMAGAGTIFLVRKSLGPRGEQLFYAAFLIMIAMFYLAFIAYFGAATAWWPETIVVLVFVTLALVGARIPSALIAGYFLHGMWDLLHELQAHGAYSGFQPGRLSQIPLAYGFFCAAFDLVIAAYCYARRTEWSAAWSPESS